MLKMKCLLLKKKNVKYIKLADNAFSHSRIDENIERGKKKRKKYNVNYFERHNDKERNYNPTCAFP